MMVARRRNAAAMSIQQAQYFGTTPTLDGSDFRGLTGVEVASEVENVEIALSTHLNSTSSYLPTQPSTTTKPSRLFIESGLVTRQNRKEKKTKGLMQQSTERFDMQA